MTHSWKICSCGNRMANNAKTCMQCRRKPEAYVCPSCGGPKSFQSRTCMKCRFSIQSSIGIPDRSKHRDFSQLDPLWIAQFVGWFHGEGSVRIHRTNKGTYTAGCAIKLRADDHMVLRDIQEKLGGNFRFPSNRENHSPEVLWEMTNLHGVKMVLELIRDHTIIPGKKLQDVLLVLRFINWRLNQTYHQVDWSNAALMKEELQGLRVFKLPDDD